MFVCPFGASSVGSRPVATAAGRGLFFSWQSRQVATLRMGNRWMSACFFLWMGGEAGSELVADLGKNLGAGEVLYEHIVGGDAYAEVAGQAQVGASADVDSETRYACGDILG